MVDLTIGEIREHPQHGKVQLTEIRAGIVWFRPIDGAPDHPCRREYWNSLPYWPSVDHLPEHDGRKMGREGE